MPPGRVSRLAALLRNHTHARTPAQVTVVHGRAGSGKSALLAKITDDIKSSVKNGTTVSLFMRTVGHRRRRRRRSAHSMR